MSPESSNSAQPEPVPVQPKPVGPQPIEPEPIAPQPVQSEPEPVSLEGEGEPVPVAPSEVAPAVEDDVDEPISLVDTEDEGNGVSKIRARGAGSPLDGQKMDFARPLNKTGTGATRCRLFHCRIALAPLEHMQTSINEWLDSDENLEVKHVGHLIGIMEGKSPEPNLIVMAWY